MTAPISPSDIPGYYWGTEQVPPEDADTADLVEVTVTYGVDAQTSGDGTWTWIGSFANREPAEDFAAYYTGCHAPVPVYRRVIEVTRTFYVWGGDEDGRHADRVAAAEAHEVVSEHTYTGPPDPWSS